MKPSVPEKGTVVRREGPRALVMMEAGKACKGCGMAAIGLCKAGGASMFLEVLNTRNADVGEIVMVGLQRGTTVKGYLLAYLLPLFGFIAGSLAGSMAGAAYRLPWLDVGAGFASLGLTAAVTLQLLKRLDRSSTLEIRRVIRDPSFCRDMPTDEERVFGSLYECR